MKEKFIMEGKKAAWTLTCKFINDFLVMVILYAIILLGVEFGVKSIGGLSNTTTQIIAGIFALVSTFELILAGICTMKWTKKKMAFTNSKGAITGIIIITAFLLVSRAISVVADMILNGNYILNIAAIVFDVIFGITTIKYCSYNVKQLVTTDPASEGKLNGTVSYKIVGVIGIILLVAGLLVNVLKVPAAFVEKEEKEIQELMKEANEATLKANIAQANTELSFAYAQALNRGVMAGEIGVALNEQGQVMTKEDYLKVLGEKASLVDFDVDARGAFVMKK